jgi:hypothetical protein
MNNLATGCIFKGVLQMEKDSKLQIYKGIIQYLLESTNYTLKNIADLSNISIKTIRSIYYEDNLIMNLSCELTLLNLYRFILEMDQKKTLRSIE